MWVVRNCRYETITATFIKRFCITIWCNSYSHFTHTFIYENKQNVNIYDSSWIFWVRISFSYVIGGKMLMENVACYTVNDIWVESRYEETWCEVFNNSSCLLRKWNLNLDPVYAYTYSWIKFYSWLTTVKLKLVIYNEMDVIFQP